MLLLVAALLDRTDRHEDGQGLAEYALILALIAVASILVMMALGGAIGGVMQTIVDNL